MPEIQAVCGAPWFSCNLQVESLEEVSARTNTGRRCFQRMVLCNLWQFWHWPPGRHWLDGLRPNSAAQQVSPSLRTLSCTHNDIAQNAIFLFPALSTSYFDSSLASHQLPLASRKARTADLLSLTVLCLRLPVGRTALRLCMPCRLQSIIWTRIAAYQHLSGARLGC